MILAFAVLAFLPDKPSQATWLAPEEKEWLTGRLAAEANNQHCVQHLSLMGALSDKRILQMCLIFIISSTAGNAVGFFGPKLLLARSGNTWSNSYISLILTIPAIVGAIAMSLAASHSDRTGQRRMHVTIGYIIAGLAFLACVYAPTAQWVVVALAVNTLGERIGAGSYWALTTNLLGAKAAAGGIAMINSIGNLGGFFGPVLMGFLMKISGGSYAAGLTTAGCLMILSALLAMQMLKSHPTHTAE
jgi:ACS family tartrate transporter-like MFS transporter